MAPLATYDPPHKQLGRLMVMARRRGLSFDEFWTEAMRPQAPLIMTTHPLPPVGAWDTAWCVRWPTDRNDRITWQAAIRDAREGWRRAYNHEERTKPESALAMLSDDLDTIATVAAALAGDEDGVEDAAALMSEAA